MTLWFVYDVMVCLWRYSWFMTLWFVYDVIVGLWRYGLFMTLWFVWWHHSFFLKFVWCRHGLFYNVRAWRYDLFHIMFSYIIVFYDIMVCLMTSQHILWLVHDIIVCFYDVLACYITLWLALWHHSLFWWPYDLFAHLKRDCSCKENCPLPLVTSVIYLILYSGFKFQEKKIQWAPLNVITSDHTSLTTINKW